MSNAKINQLIEAHTVANRARHLLYSRQSKAFIKYTKETLGIIQDSYEYYQLRPQWNAEYKRQHAKQFEKAKARTKRISKALRKELKKQGLKVVWGRVGNVAGIKPITK